ncbi:MAG TPA: conjugative transposon protein TraM [Dysgonomonas sp.]|uniref:conjugative transposon protein TraM n=2 Tax=unclassified Dysgonomonas TaxID=2630389 RepID=UPI002CCDF8BA|nr:conjugative transposon protein TraM [Dysgonomonas sp.]HML66581.1 conjugative transposon protein TraM [Dysgonomonas sp.]
MILVMNSDKINNNEKVEEKEELTPEQIRRRKQLLIFPLFFLVFAGGMYLIFAPSASDKEKENEGLGYNAELPMPKEEGIISDKKGAYEKDEFESMQHQKRRTLQDMSFAFDGTDDSSSDGQKTGSSNSEAPSSAKIQSSVYAYQNVNRQVSSFYEAAPQIDQEAEQRQLELEWRLQELERKEEERKQTQQIAEDQLALMEKSYQMAAKYMPATTQGQIAEPIQPTEEVQAAPVSPVSNKNPISVSRIQEQVVSSLPVQMSDSAFIAEYSKPRNTEFHSIERNEPDEKRNGVYATIYRTVTLTDGQGVQLRLAETVQVGGRLIPKGTVVSGTAKISGERVDILVASILLDGHILPVELAAYDMDGRKGVSVPGSAEMNAAKEMAANMVLNMGTSISITDNAASQIAADLSKGVIQGASQYLSKKMRTVKVTLKAGHRVLLISDK